MEWDESLGGTCSVITEKKKDTKCDCGNIFGYPAYFNNGNMFVGVYGDKLFLRLSDVDIAEIMKKCKNVIASKPLPGRAMEGYLVLPKSFTLTMDFLLYGWANQ